MDKNKAYRGRALRIALGITMLIFLLLAGSASSMENSSSRIEEHYSDAPIYNSDRTLTDFQAPVLSPFGAELARPDGSPDIPHENDLLDRFHISRMLEINGMHFELKNNSYLNVTLDSSEPINITLESAPKMVTMHIESASGAASTQINIGGFAPLTIYHKYEDDYHNDTAFTTDANGSYTYTQDLSRKHLIFIQPTTSTKFINDNTTGGDCTSIGEWYPANKTCTLTTELGDTIQIDSNGITLIGNGHTITGSNTGFGVYLSSRTGVTIRNLNVMRFSYGIYLHSSSNNMLNGNDASNNGDGIWLDSSSNNNLIGNTANSNQYRGIDLYSSSNNNLIDNIVNSNTYDCGIYLEFSSYNTLSGNDANSNYYYDDPIYDYNGQGIILQSSNYNMLSTNNALNNVGSGIDLVDSSYNTLSGNNASNNANEANGGYGISLWYFSNNNILSGNNASNNGYGILLESSSNNMLNGNNASNNGYAVVLQSSSNNKIYNNIFNNTNTIFFYYLNINAWNTTKTSGKNIVGGPYLGGNFWANPSGTGFSQTCSDVDTDGICDSTYLLDGNNIDYLPLAAEITVVSPNGGENWLRGTSHSITWSSLGNPGSNVKLELLKNGVAVGTITSSTPNDGSHAWTISSTRALGTDYKIRVTSTNTPAYTDTSDNNFTIGGINVTSPNGGETWIRGTSNTITWNSAGIPGPNVKLELLKNGVAVGTITSSTPNDGSHAWTISSTRALGTDYKIRVTSTSNPSYTDTSNNNFKIGGINVTSPNGGETWIRGTSHSITWSSLGNPGSNVKIELLKNGVAVGTITSSTPNDGSHTWTISLGRTPGIDYKIRVTSTSNSAYKDTSDNNFRIS